MSEYYPLQVSRWVEIHVPKPSKPLYRCSLNDGHRLTKNQAKASGGLCTHCGARLRAFAQFVKNSMTDEEIEIIVGLRNGNVQLDYEKSTFPVDTALESGYKGSTKGVGDKSLT